MAKFVDVSGEKFGRLTVVRFAGKNKFNQTVFDCICDCGNELSAVPKGLLRTGNTKSCGCLGREALIKRNLRHGKTKTPLYKMWMAMLSRCNNPNNKNYFRYGGRGIKCLWQTFEEFEADMGKEYYELYKGRRSTSIERVNLNGNYCKENCIWADDKIQANNKSNNRVIEYNGEKKTLSQWADQFGVESSRIRQRLNLGYSIEEALTLPKYAYRKS